MEQSQNNPTHQAVMDEIYKWADDIRLPAGYDGDLEALWKRLEVLWVKDDKSPSL